MSFRILVSPLCIAFVAGCAGSLPPGPSQVGQGWKGDLVGHRVGFYLEMGRKTYTVAEFEAVAQADDALRELEPGIKWVSVDSGNRDVGKLGGWDLDSLGDLLGTDTAILSAAPSGKPPSLDVRDPAVSGPTREALARVGKAFGVDLLIVLKPGGGRNAKDSLEAFKDPAWFGVFDAAKGSLLYSLDVPSSGAKSAARSAETDWARQAWKSFATGVRALRKGGK
jgi:hypothetical protein